MPAILAAISLIQPALQVIAAFKGSAVSAKTNTDVQSAVGVVTALVPLVQDFTNGAEITEDDVRDALTGEHAALDAFDAAIKAQGG